MERGKSGMSDDTTKIPMPVVHRNGTVMAINGSNNKEGV